MVGALRGGWSREVQSKRRQHASLSQILLSERLCSRAVCVLVACLPMVGVVLSRLATTVPAAPSNSPSELEIVGSAVVKICVHRLDRQSFATGFFVDSHEIGRAHV